MKRPFIVRLSLALTLVLFLSGPAWVAAAPLTDPDNQHNLSSAATHGGPQAESPIAGGTDQICIFCHTPHSGTANTPLWSRPDTSVATFPLYAQPLAIKGDLQGDPSAANRSQYKNDGSVTYPNGSSRLCLSCHDGVTAINILNDNTTIAMVSNQNFVTGNAVIDLSTSHPISFIYNNNVLTTDIAPNRPVGSYQLPPGGDGVDTPLDGQQRMQCTTCHDPHNDTSLDGGGLPPFWRHTTVVNGTYDEYEEVCAQCHVGGNPAGPSGDHDPGPGI
jgi:hypothetical protein